MQEQNLERHIKSVIHAIFKHAGPEYFEWTPQRIRRGRTLIDPPFLSHDFAEAAKLVFRQVFPTVKIEDFISYRRDGHAANLVGYEPKEQVSFFLLVCDYYPIATLRPTFGYSYYADGLMGIRGGWGTPSDEEILRSIFRTELTVLNREFSALLENYGYIFMPYDAPLFKTSIRRCLFWKTPIWDYLFYIGIGEYVDEGWKSEIY